MTRRWILLRSRSIWRRYSRNRFRNRRSGRGRRRKRRGHGDRLARPRSGGRHSPHPHLMMNRSHHLRGDLLQKEEVRSQLLGRGGRKRIEMRMRKMSIWMKWRKRVESGSSTSRNWTITSSRKRTSTLYECSVLCSWRYLCAPFFPLFLGSRCFVLCCFRHWLSLVLYCIAFPPIGGLYLAFVRITRASIRAMHCRFPKLLLHRASQPILLRHRP